MNRGEPQDILLDFVELFPRDIPWSKVPQQMGRVGGSGLILSVCISPHSTAVSKQVAQCREHTGLQVLDRSVYRHPSDTIHSGQGTVRPHRCERLRLDQCVRHGPNWHAIGAAWPGRILPICHCQCEFCGTTETWALEVGVVGGNMAQKVLEGASQARSVLLKPSVVLCDMVVALRGYEVQRSRVDCIEGSAVFLP